LKSTQALSGNIDQTGIVGTGSQGVFFQPPGF
jgi:hypothetical protein